jgi:flagellar basal body-associated protein FliL
VKSLKISVILTTIIIAAFLCGGFAAAINQDEVSAHALFSSETLQAGQTATVNIFFSSTSADSLQITYASIHFDWLPTGAAFGLNLTSAPVTVPAGGDYVFQPITFTVPADATTGEHNCTIGMDGLQGSSSTSFSWDSSAIPLEITGGTNPTASPTSTPLGGDNSQLDMLLLVAAAAVVVVVVVLMLVLVLHKKRPKPKSAAKQSAGQPEAPAPEKKPETGQDFNI